MKEKIIAYLKEEISSEPLDDIDINEDLLGSGIVDSLGMMRLVVFLEKEFQKKIGPEDMTVENFKTVQSISDYLTQ
ncbi:acyl carrier protein [Muriicola sp. Z0-33]|uniref:acyl carrier protein n=1 Tax=Muriicola sp. Z0-33 TaxID=2816957 RepID=UPI002238CE75|nr:acyl carrier protein [Muriicola sp. Z0-33]MCW5515233.1 acyl carrier protein [Muriicola sp. Z0-33]